MPTPLAPMVQPQMCKHRRQRQGTWLERMQRPAVLVLVLVQPQVQAQVQVQVLVLVLVLVQPQGPQLMLGVLVLLQARRPWQQKQAWPQKLAWRGWQLLTHSRLCLGWLV